MRTVALLYRNQAALQQAFCASKGNKFAGLPMLCRGGGIPIASLIKRVVLFETRIPQGGVRQEVKDPEHWIKEKIEVNLGLDTVQQILQQGGWKGLKTIQVPKAGSLQKPQRHPAAPPLGKKSRATTKV